MAGRRIARRCLLDAAPRLARARRARRRARARPRARSCRCCRSPPGRGRRPTRGTGPDTIALIVAARACSSATRATMARARRLLEPSATTGAGPPAPRLQAGADRRRAFATRRAAVAAARSSACWRRLARARSSSLASGSLDERLLALLWRLAQLWGAPRRARRSSLPLRARPTPRLARLHRATGPTTSAARAGRACSESGSLRALPRRSRLAAPAAGQARTAARIARATRRAAGAHGASSSRWRAQTVEAYFELSRSARHRAPSAPPARRGSAAPTTPSGSRIECAARRPALPARGAAGGRTLHGDGRTAPDRGRRRARADLNPETSVVPDKFLPPAVPHRRRHNGDGTVHVRPSASST